MLNQKRPTSAIWWLILSGVIIIIDQLTKYLVLTHLVYLKPYHVLPFLNFTLTFNPGSAFGFLGNAGGWQIYLLSAVVILISLALCIWLYRTPANFVSRALGLSLIIGGALGNLIDRVRLTYVIDFIDFHIKTWHYATFNVADSAVCVGAFFLIFSILYRAKQPDHPDRIQSK